MIKFVIIGILAIALMVFIYEESWIVGIIAGLFMVGSLITNTIITRSQQHKDQ